MKELQRIDEENATNRELPATSSAAFVAPPPASNPIGIAAEHAIVHFDGESPTGPRVELSLIRVSIGFHEISFSFPYPDLFLDPNQQPTRFLIIFFLTSC